MWVIPPPPPPPVTTPTETTLFDCYGSPTRDDPTGDVLWVWRVNEVCSPEIGNQPIWPRPQGLFCGPGGEVELVGCSQVTRQQSSWLPGLIISVWHQRREPLLSSQLDAPPAVEMGVGSKNKPTGLHSVGFACLLQGPARWGCLSRTVTVLLLLWEIPWSSPSVLPLSDSRLNGRNCRCHPYCR